ncbi:PREDICTED: protein distal antenna-related-like [Trachymyrmex septentrionalis]|uniref:protein distal antenna-related-like n=1 Tax=Trachymyrmex septentrionalis TaxID=34720 RepID=UPI00084EFA45|nr:PREDICTED: protein distal antenna-related-like [Trachymyrmex septentrionalis]
MGDEQETPLDPSKRSRQARQRRLRSPETKIHAVNRVHNGESKAAVARSINVPESTLRGWCKLTERVDEFEVGPSQKRIKLENTSATNTMSNIPSTSAGQSIVNDATIYNSYLYRANLPDTTKSNVAAAILTTFAKNSEYYALSGYTNFIETLARTNGTSLALNMLQQQQQLQQQLQVINWGT